MRITWQDLMGYAAVVIAGAAVIMLMVVGGVTIFEVGVADWAALPSAFSAIALLAVLAAAFALVRWLSDGVRDLLAELRRTSSSPHSRPPQYVQYLATGVGVLVAAASKPISDPFLALAVGAVVGVVTLGAAMVIQRFPLLGLGLFLAILTAVTVVMLITEKVDVLAWLSERNPREVLFIGIAFVSVFGVTGAVWYVERRLKHNGRWAFGIRFREFMRGSKPAIE